MFLKLPQNIFYPNFGCFTITLEPEMLESQPKAQKTEI